MNRKKEEEEKKKKAFTVSLAFVIGTLEVQGAWRWAELAVKEVGSASWMLFWAQRWHDHDPEHVKFFHASVLSLGPFFLSALLFLLFLTRLSPITL